MDTIQIPEKTMVRINQIQEQMNILSATMQNILSTVLEVSGAEGEYSFNGKELVRKE